MRQMCVRSFVRAVVTCVLLVGSFGVACAQAPVAGARPPAGPLTPPVLAIVDFPAVVRESGAAKSVRSQIDAIGKKYESEVGGIEKALLDADKKLGEDRAKMSPEQFAEARRKLEQQYQDGQKQVQERQRKLEAAYGKALQQIEEQLLNIVADMAKTRQVNIVLGKSAVVIAEPRFDMTREVLDRLNAALPNVTVPTPK